MNVCNLRILSGLRKSPHHPFSQISASQDPENLYWRLKGKRPLVIRAYESFSFLAVIPPMPSFTPPVSPVPPWTDLSTYVHPDMLDITNKSNQSASLLSSFRIMAHTIYHGFFAIYTDGSKAPDPVSPTTASAVYVPSTKRCTTWRLPAHADVVTAELFAIYRACVVADDAGQLNTVVYTDSRSSLLLILSHKPRSYREEILKIQATIIRITQSKNLHLQWIPGHSGIPGNEVADRAAKLALNSPDITPMVIPETIYRRIIKDAAYKLWSEEALRAISGSHLGRFRSDTTPHPWARAKDRALDVALLRLRIGHSRLNAHLHRIGIEPSPNCEWCMHAQETIEHVLLRCFRHHSIRTELVSYDLNATATNTRHRRKPAGWG